MGSLTNILQSGNTTRIAKANYRASVATTDNTNKLEIAKGGFTDFMRTLSNKSRVDAGAKEFNFQMDQLSEELRARGTKNMNAEVQLANARGALFAQAGAAGVGGSSADLMDSMVRLQTDLDKQTTDNATNLLASRGAKTAAQVLSNSWNNVDMSRTFGNFDYRSYIQPSALKHKTLTLIGVAAATYFGGPQAGEAAADGALGEWQAQNGNFTGASTGFGNAIAGAGKAWQGMSQRGNKSWASSAFDYDDGTGGGGYNVGTGNSSDYLSSWASSADTSYLGSGGFNFAQ